MPEVLKALIVVLGLAAITFAIAKTPACASASNAKDFDRRRNAWFGITLVAFMAHNFWVYIVLTTLLLLYTAPLERNKLSLYFFVLFAVPPISSEISGLGILKHFFAIDYFRLLSLTILLPAFLQLQNQRDSERFGRLLPDKLVIGYLILNMLLMASASTFTNTLRHSVFYSFIDIFLPYYVASRSLRTLQEFKDTLNSFVIAALVLSAIAVFEYARHWLLYATVDEALGTPWGYGNYLERGEGGLRAIGSTGHPIVLGYVIAVAIGFFLFLRKSISSSAAWWTGLVSLIVGLLVTASRGPWIGAITLLLAFACTASSSYRSVIRLILVAIVFLPVFLVTPLGENFIAYMPFIGTAASESVTYRERLFQVAIQVILQNPFFGAFDYFFSPAMQELKQGEGIIDVVNTYIGIGLSRGLVGLSLFSGFFIIVSVGILTSMRNLENKRDERYLLGQALFCTLIGILVIIGTVSSISSIPVIYWAVAGLGVAYSRMLKNTTVSDVVPQAAGPVVFGQHR